MRQLRWRPRDPSRLRLAAVLFLAGGSLPLFCAAQVVPPGPCSNIQQAIAALPPDGGEVVLSAGRYLCSEPVVLDRNGVTLRGERGATILFLAENSNSPVIVIGSIETPVAQIVRNVRVAGLIIDGNRARQTMECWGGPCDTGGRTVIRNNGITVRGADDVLIERVAVARARSGGIVTERRVRRLTVRGFTASDNYFDGLAGYLTEDSLFEDLKLVNNCSAGLSFDDRFDHNLLQNVLILRDSAISCELPLLPGRVGVFMRNSRNNVFQGLQIRNPREDGVFLAQVDNDPATAATGNTFLGTVIAEAGGAGIRIANASCTNNLFVGVQSTGNRGGCVSDATADPANHSAVVCR
jgi:polygalacturonase